MTTWGLIPVKAFDRGKSRLAGVLCSNERTCLARELFEHVVSTLNACDSVDHVAIVTDSKDIAISTLSLGVTPLLDSEDAKNLADIIDAALSDLVSRGASRAVICMSDLPSLCVDDLDRALRGLDEADIVLAPDLDHMGTNVLALQPPDCLPSCFGNQDSFIRHQAAARDRGLTTAVFLNMGMGFDVDEPRDLQRLSEPPRTI